MDRVILVCALVPRANPTPNQGRKNLDGGEVARRGFSHRDGWVAVGWMVWMGNLSPSEFTEQRTTQGRRGREGKQALR